MGNLRSMLNAKAVALIGATEKQGAIGRTILENLLPSNKTKVYPVNPNRKKVLGVDAYPDIAGIPEHVFQVLVGDGASVGYRFVTHEGVRKVSPGEKHGKGWDGETSLNRSPGPRSRGRSGVAASATRAPALLDRKD